MLGFRPVEVKGYESGRQDAMVRRVTLADVAREAGVGRATASRALSSDDHRDVSSETREHVREVAARLGYRASATARALRTGRSRALSVILPDSSWSWYEAGVRSVSRAAGERGYRVLLHVVPLDLASTAQGNGNSPTATAIADLADLPSEGLILFGPALHSSVQEQAARLGLPVVAVDDVAPDNPVPTVSCDNRDGARAAVGHLLALGRRRIAHLTISPDVGFARDRHQGYLDALAEAGIRADSRLVITHEAMTPPARIPELEEFLAEGPECDALFTVGDFMAAPALRTLRSAGRRVPDDVAVVSFDDDTSAPLLDPPLTTVRQPYDAMGETAVDLLLRQIQGEHIPAERWYLPGTLILRKSAG
ncbi:LacI family DNA-binding transcriptional regulator [Streptomyces sp. NPDC056112]|uniref:LacI family DNA-binding transcriptional regulator n=1 Tax=unclassified Streptomyces TaxID=2593676 RepID=UPI001CD7320A|nr:LacI family DNA-binding transcriptional regulator [Streptomyces sp. CoT10]